MKLYLALSLCFPYVALTNAGNTYRPKRIDYKTLMDEEAFTRSETRQVFLDALTSVGLVSVTGIPSSQFRKHDVLSWNFHECVASSEAAQEYTFPDKTRRRTLGTHTIPGPGGAQRIFREDESTSNSEACKNFSKASDEFRSKVADVTQAFASRLTSVLKDSIAAPLLVTQDGSHQFATFSDVVANGEHLEHFHSYQRAKNQRLGKENYSTTLELHTDQGLFIVFTPGQLVKMNNQESSKIASGLYIHLPEGNSKGVEVEFDNEDDLVIMLGDGVKQLVNPKIVTKRADSTSEMALTLRATPHALRVPFHEEKEARVWYGRMILPPSQGHSDSANMSHGELRQQLIQAGVSNSRTRDETLLSLGCSERGVTARILNGDESCNENYIYCWHTCMSMLDYNASGEICASRSLRSECINPRDQIYIEGHGDFYPGCTNSTVNATEFPELPTYPRDDSKCPEDAWKNFSSAEGYNGTYELLKDLAKIHWNVLDDGVIEGRLDFNGLFGYLGFGFANEADDMLNGMLGGSVIMALPGGDYSPITGLNLSLAPQVNEYHIGIETAFRHWFDPVKSQASSVYSVNPTDCFVSLLFKTNSINGISFNVTGTNSMIWAANPTDYFAAYHGDHRSRVVLDWMKGAGYAYSKPAAMGGSASSESSSSATVSCASSFSATCFTLVMTLFAFVVSVFH